MTSPLISIIITAFNRADIIERAIKSALEQTIQDTEVIVVDDASTDNTVEVVKSLSDPRIKLIKNQKNLGIGGAKNVGIQNATGIYVAFLDSDDDWVAHKLETQLEALKNSSDNILLSFSAFWVYRLDTGKIVTRRPRKYNSWLNSILLGETFSLGSTLLAKRDLFDEIGLFNVNLTRLQDRDWTIRYLEKHPKWIYIEEPLARIYNSGWPSAEQVEHSTRALYEANKERLDNIASGSASIFQESLRFEVAVTYYRQGEIAKGFFLMLGILIRRPMSIGYYTRRLFKKIVERDLS